jgi:hypothetical protein
MNWDRSAIVTVYGLEERKIGIQFPARAEYFLFAIVSRPTPR